MKCKTEMETYVRERICKSLKEKGISAYQLGAQGTFSHKTIYNVMEGVTKPSIEMLELISNTTGITMGEFFKEYDEKHSQKQRLNVKAPKDQRKANDNKLEGLEGIVRIVRQLSHGSMELPVYIIHSAENKELYLVAKLENNGSFDDSADERLHLILKDKLGVHS